MVLTFSIAAYPVWRQHLANCVPIIRIQTKLDISCESDDSHEMSSLILPYLSAAILIGVYTFWVTILVQAFVTQ